MSACITEPMSPTSGAAIGWLLSNSAGLDVDLDELGVGIPLRRLAVAEQPIEPGTDEHDNVGFAQSQRTRRGDRLRMIVGDQTFGHRHR